MGLVLTLQLRPSMVDYGVESQLPAIVGIAIIREIGPVITALIFAGKIGSSIGAELGSMKVTEQIDAMEVSGTNPFKYLVVTRVMAAICMLPILSVLSDAISLYGAYLGVNIRGAVSFHLFWVEAALRALAGVHKGWLNPVPPAIRHGLYPCPASPFQSNSLLPICRHRHHWGAYTRL